MIEQEERLLRCAQSVVHTREPLLLFVSAGVWQARGEKAERRGGKVWTREEMKCIMSGGAKKKEKQEKSPRGRRKRGEGEGKEGKKPRKRNEIVAWRKIWKDLYPFKGTDLCREVYSRGN